MWWINTGMPKQISLVLGPQELREWLAPWSVLAAESTLCDSWKSVSSPEQEWAKSDLFLKYLLSLKNNSSFQLMLPDCCSPPPLFFFSLFVCVSVYVSPYTTSLYFKLLQYCCHSGLGNYGKICQVYFRQGNEKKSLTWWYMLPQLEENLCSGTGPYTGYTRGYLSTICYLPSCLCQHQVFCSDHSNIKCTFCVAKHFKAGNA